MVVQYVSIFKTIKIRESGPKVSNSDPWAPAPGLLRFKHCGAWNLYDFHQPSTLCYYWNEQGNCFKRSQGLRFAIRLDGILYEI